ncbi:MAG TPA: glycosyltransferase family 39 protein [Candidatus Nitrosotenuis sp.]|nr:glycosyltransferase family 39 protein [Candidatus Nitrosotenuis sp.]
MLVFLALGSHRLGEVSLWADEGWDVHVVTRPWAEMWRTLDQGSVHPPLYHLLLRAWARAFGTGAWALRSLSLLFSLATLVAVLSFARRFWGPAVGLTAGALLAGSAFFVGMTQEIRLYPLVALACTLGAFLVLRAFEEPGRGTVVAACLGLFLAEMADVWGGVLWAGANLLALARRGELAGRGFPFRLWWAGQALVALLPLAGVLYLSRREAGLHQLMFDLPFSPWVYLKILHFFAVGGGLPPVPVASAASALAWGTLLILLGAGAWSWRGSRSGLSLLVLALLPWVATALALALAGLDLATERRLSFTWPLLAVVAAAGLVALARSPARPLAAVCALVLLGGNAWSLSNWYGHPGYQRARWREATDYLKEHVGPGEAVVLQNTYQIYVYQYYWPDHPVTYLLGPRQLEDLAAVARRHPRLWYVSCQAYQMDPHLEVAGWLAAHCRAGPVKVFDLVGQPDARLVIVPFSCPSPP